VAAKAHLGISMIITVGVTNRTHLGISTMMATAAAGWEEVSGAIPKEVTNTIVACTIMLGVSPATLALSDDNIASQMSFGTNVWID
jgi:hypothetical protein